MARTSPRPPSPISTHALDLAHHIQTDIFSYGAQAAPLAGERPRRRARVSPECPSRCRVPAVSSAGTPPAQRLEADDEGWPRRAGDPYPRGRRVSGAVPGDAARSGLRAARLREEAPAHTTTGCGSGAVPPQGAARATRPPVGGNDGDQDHEGLAQHLPGPRVFPGGGGAPPRPGREIGRASCRERV